MKIAIAGGTGLVGRHVVEEAQVAGHDVVVLARSAGVDTRTGEGLAAALAGVQVIIDTTNPGTVEEGPATEFFVESSAALQRLGEEAGVEHLLVLSIVGIDRIQGGYYAAKLAQERAARSGAVAATIARATQFHEFPAQMIGWNRQGSSAGIPDLRVQTVAARTVGRFLVEVAEGQPVQNTIDLAGPEETELVTLARRFVERFSLGIDVVPTEAGVPAGALLPAENARLEGPTFDEWLETDDSYAMATADQ
jgi:uncharacterized protein YbjT (DUF2867 family)